MKCFHPPTLFIFLKGLEIAAVRRYYPADNDDGLDSMISWIFYLDFCEIVRFKVSVSELQKTHLQ